MPTTVTKERRYIKAAAVRERYDDVTGMTLYRWVRDPKLGFPQPVVINGVRFFDLDQLDEFDSHQRELTQRGRSLDGQPEGGQQATRKREMINAAPETHR